MIVKDEQDFIAQSISSVLDIVDEIIVVDTGCKDKTIDVAKQTAGNKLKIFNFEWINDFSAAKNFAIKQSTTDWILVLDADELIEKEDANKIKELINTNEHAAFAFISRHYTSDKLHTNWQKIEDTKRKDYMKNFIGYYDVKYITRLFKNDPSIHFTGKVHEDINPSIFENSQKGKNTEIPIHHLHLEKKGEFVEDKQKQYYELSKKKLQETPDSKICLDVAVGDLLFNDNMDSCFKHLKQTLEIDKSLTAEENNKFTELLNNKDYLNAAKLFRDKLNFSNHDLNSVFNLAKTLYRKKKIKEAFVILRRLHKVSPHSTPILEYTGVCLSLMNMNEQAIVVFKRATGLENVKEKKAQFYFNLGSLYEKTKQNKEAVESFKKAVELNHKASDQIQRRIEMLINNPSSFH